MESESDSKAKFLVNQILRTTRDNAGNMPMSVEIFLAKMIDDLLTDSRQLIHESKEVLWYELYRRVGIIVVNLLDLNGEFEVPKFCSLLMEKHKKYGAEPLLRWQHLGILMRLDSKISRYLNLAKEPEENLEESKEDTAQDILGYCILGILLLKRKNPQ